MRTTEIRDGDVAAGGQDYGRIERAIRFLDQETARRPSLADVAAHLGMSEFHVQRMFTRWAGVSPKRFLQFLTAAHVRRLLESAPNVLDATYDAGLSSPGRLHDLLVTVDAVTPGEERARGEGLEIAWGVHPSPFGEVLLGATSRGVCWLSFVEPADPVPGPIARRWPLATLREDLRRTAPVADRIFAGGTRVPLPVHLRGTNLQLKVWEALLRIPAGSVTTYAALAELAGAPRAVRAVASAVGRNPIGYLIPCHRVIRSTGAFGQYAGGATRKMAILGWESARRWGEADAGVPAATSRAEHPALGAALR